MAGRSCGDARGRKTPPPVFPPTGKVVRSPVAGGPIAASRRVIPAPFPTPPVSDPASPAAPRTAADAIHGAPNSAAAWRLHAQVALARGRAEEALADFHRALAIDPDDREVLLETADVYRRLGRPQRALATLAVLGESYGPTQTPPEVFRLEGLALEDLDRPVDALECYRQAAARGGPQTEMAARITLLEERLAAERPQAVMAAGGPDAARR